MSIYSNLVNPLNYQEYKQLVFSYASFGKSTGESSIEHVNATKINASRIKRLDRFYFPSEIFHELVSKIESPVKWIVITESWCGDGAQNLPLISKLADLNPLIQLIIVLRDENLAIMDAHLTRGTRSIPKLIAINVADENVIFEWGPRPQNIQNSVTQFKIENPEISHDDFVKKLHLLYSQDKGVSFEKDFIKLIK